MAKEMPKSNNVWDPPVSNPSVPNYQPLPPAPAQPSKPVAPSSAPQQMPGPQQVNFPTPGKKQ